MTSSAGSNVPHPRRVLIAGGGVAGLETMLALHNLAGARVEVEVLAPDHMFHYRPLDVACPFGLGSVRQIPVSDLVTSAGAIHRRGRLIAVDADAKQVETAAGERIPYDALVVATGARALEAVPGALTFRGRPDLPAFKELLAKLGKETTTLAFALPPRATWALPLYELAFLTAGELGSRTGGRHTDLVIVTHEAAPLEMFGPQVSDAVRLLLDREGIALWLAAEAIEHRDGHLHLADGALPADRVVAMPRLEGPAIEGLPRDEHGFLPTDAFGRVPGVPDVYAAGDVTTHPIKQGGLASQQADAVASVLAHWAGARVVPRPFRPILRGQLLTVGATRFLEVDLGDPRHVSRIGFHPPAWPTGKIASEHLTPFLAEHGIGDPIGYHPPPPR